MIQDEAPTTYFISGTRKSIQKIRRRLINRGIGPAYWKSSVNATSLEAKLTSQQKAEVDKAKRDLRISVTEKQKGGSTEMNSAPIVRAIPIYCSGSCGQLATDRNFNGLTCPKCGEPTTTHAPRTEKIESSASNISLFGFTDDPENIRNFILETRKFLQENDKKTLSSKETTLVFSRVLGRPTPPRATGPILRGLVFRGHLRKFPDPNKKGGYIYRPKTAISTAVLQGFADNEKSVAQLLERLQYMQQTEGAEMLTSRQITQAICYVTGRDVSGKTISSPLNRLVKRGVLIRSGDSNHRMYTIAHKEGNPEGQIVPAKLPSPPNSVPSAPVVPETRATKTTTGSISDTIQQLKMLAEPWQEALALEHEASDHEQKASDHEQKAAEHQRIAAELRSRIPALEILNPRAKMASEELSEIRRMIDG